MIQEMKIYVCDTVPTDDDISTSIDIARNEHILIKLLWYVEYSGTYHAVIAHDSTIESVKAQMPKIYPV